MHCFFFSVLLLVLSGQCLAVVLQAKEKGKKAQLQCMCSEISCSNCPVCRGDPVLLEGVDADELGLSQLEKEAACVCKLCVCPCNKV